MCEDFPTEKYIFLNKAEKRKLLMFKKILTHPEIAVDSAYQRVEFHDTHTYVDEFRPAYHKNPKCERLLHDFDGVVIPQKIREKGIDAIEQFRQWYRDNQHYLEEDKDDLFYTLLHARWHVQKNEIDIVSRNNSGSTYFENTIDECHDKIVRLLEEWKEWLDDDKRGSIRQASFRYSYGAKNAYLGDKEEELPYNNTGYSDLVIKKCMSEMQHKFKEPIIDLIRQYYMIKYNPNLEMNENVLNQLGFGKCKDCYTRGVLMSFNDL